MDVRIHEELARPWVGVCVPFALSLPLPTFLEKKKKTRGDGDVPPDRVWFSSSVLDRV